MVEAGTNMKAMQEIIGHSDISTTMNIYAEATKELKEKEMEKFGENLQNSLSNLEETYQKFTTDLPILYKVREKYKT